jgi:hypothetical protein
MQERSNSSEEIAEDSHVNYFCGGNLKMCIFAAFLDEVHGMSSFALSYCVKFRFANRMNEYKTKSSGLVAKYPQDDNNQDEGDEKKGKDSKNGSKCVWGHKVEF